MAHFRDLKTVRHETERIVNASTAMCFTVSQTKWLIAEAYHGCVCVFVLPLHSSEGAQYMCRLRFIAFSLWRENSHWHPVWGLNLASRC